MHILVFCCLVSSIWYVCEVYNQKDSQNQTIYNLGSCWNNKVNVARIAFHLISQFCAIQSCFIFSKIVYNVTNRLDILFGDISDLLDFKKDPNTARIAASSSTDEHLPQQKLDDFIKNVEFTLDRFGLWFIFHWVSFALTAMLLTGYILQILMQFAENSAEMILKGKLIPDAFTNSESAIIWSYALNIAFFTLLHAYLFLYPCFRASAIAAARAKLIHKISKKQWVNVTPSLQNSFVQYLTAQNFAFRVPLFCATIPFGFNWVYVSFFIAICCLPKDSVRTLQSSSRLQPTKQLLLVIVNHGAGRTTLVTIIIFTYFCCCQTIFIIQSTKQHDK